MMQEIIKINNPNMSSYIFKFICNTPKSVNLIECVKMGKLKKDNNLLMITMLTKIGILVNFRELKIPFLYFL